MICTVTLDDAPASVMVARSEQFFSRKVRNNGSVNSPLSIGVQFVPSNDASIVTVALSNVPNTCRFANQSFEWEPFQGNATVEVSVVSVPITCGVDISANPVG